MTKEEVLKKLRWKRDEIYSPKSTDNIILKLLYKVQRDTVNRCIKLVE
jgi:hypothetical protein